MVHDGLGLARIPVNGGSGIEVAGNGTALLASRVSISSSVYGGGASEVYGCFLL